MIDLKEKILEACARTEKLRRDLLDNAAKEYNFLLTRSLFATLIRDDNVIS